jgi:pimeloyl-ACP methyl ester carboxylesterase
MRRAAGLFADLQSPPYQITEADLRRIDTRTLLIGGTTSHPAFAEVLGHLERGLPHLRRVTLDCGHVTYAERPAEFAAAVTAFADDL